MEWENTNRAKALAINIAYDRKILTTVIIMTGKMLKTRKARCCVLLGESSDSLHSGKERRMRTGG